MSPNLMVTLWPSFPHFPHFANHPDISGIRLNSAMLSHPELDAELQTIRNLQPKVPLYFDVKGRQLRVAEILPNPEFLDIRLNHRISVDTPTVVLFKAGADAALLGSLSENGFRLTFSHNPHWSVRVGESLHIRHPSLRVHGPLFTDMELEKIAKVKRSGLISRWFISYVEEQADIDCFQGLVGTSDELMLKIESKRGMRFVVDSFQKKPNLRLVAACGDLYVELDQPHQILQATRDIIKADPEACVGSRMMLSTIRGPSTYIQKQITRLSEKHPSACADILKVVRESDEPKIPDFADFAQLEFLRLIGYKSFMLCDELCLRGDLLENATNAFLAWRSPL